MPAAWVVDAVREFGEGMGLEKLELNEDGILCLEFDTGARLYLEARDGNVFVYMALANVSPDPELLTKLLTLSHPQSRHPMPVRTGLRSDGTAVFAVTMPERDVVLPKLQTALDLLWSVSDSIEN